MRVRCHRSFFCIARLCAAASVVILLTGLAHGRIFVVKNTLDTTDEKSLRGAIIAANQLGGNNTILLARGTYRLTIPGPGEDTGFSGDLDITGGNLTIVGVSSAQTIIDGAGTGDRVLHVLPQARLTLHHVAIQSPCPLWSPS